MANFIPTEIRAGLLKPGDIIRFCFTLADVPGTVSPPLWGFVVEEVEIVSFDQVEITAAQITGDIYIRATIPKELWVIIGKY